MLMRAGALLGAAFLLAVLLTNVRAFDPAKHDFLTGALGELQALDSQLSETVLKLRYGLVGNYDELVATLQRVNQLKNSLEEGRYAITGRGDRRTDDAMDRFSGALREKETLIEQFKQHNALLRNSVLFLPLAIEKARADALTSAALRETLQETLREALLMQVGTARRNYSETIGGIAKLSAARAAVPPRVQILLEGAILHAEHIVRSQQRMDGLIPRITSRDKGHLGSGLALAYNRSFEEDLVRSNTYRLALLVASIALLTYAAYSFVRLRENAGRLAESESRYRSVVAAMAEGIVIRDAEGRITACNASAERILGRSLDEIRGQVSFSVGWEAMLEDGAPLRKEQSPAHLALSTGQAQSNVVLGYHKPDGSELWISMSAQPLWLEGATVPSGVVTSLADITQRKQAQARLGMEHAITRVLAEADAVPEAVAAIIRTLCETLGFVYGSYWERDSRSGSLHEVAAWAVEAPGINEFAAVSRERDRRVSRAGLMRRVWTDHEPVWLADVTQEPTFKRARVAEEAGLRGGFAFPVSFGGELLGAIECFSRDTRSPDAAFLECTRAISSQIGQFVHRKKTEESWHLAANAIKHTAEGIMIYDRNRCIVFVNEAFSAITGYRSDEVTGRAPAFLRAAEDEETLYAQVWETVRETGHWQGELKRRRKSGEIYPERSTISAVNDNSGNTTHYVAVFTDISKLKEYEALLEFLAHHDALTQLPNRVLFHNRCTETIQRAQRHGNLAAVLFVDLDRFKSVNDSLGHQTGDTLLQAVSARLRACVRASDMIARAGGDEFTILLDELREPDDAAVVARKILVALAAPFMLAGQEVVVSASVGISCYPEDGADTQTLLENADAAMYHAKRQGRNTYRFYTAELNTRALEKMQLETKLRRALEREEFLLHYQPKLDLATGEIAGVEALLRWKPTDGELVPPARFIPLLEETGLIVPVGEWVLRKACEQLKIWKDAGVRAVPIAVNLSTRQFNQQNLCAVVGTILREHGIGARFLEIEITESAAMQDPEASIVMLRDLRSLGVRLTIDDFGTGYSSLSYLKRLPLDAVKIDRSFVTDLARNPDDASIAQAIIKMAHALGLKVVAEGVETASQLAFLSSHSCDQMQGYYFSRPLPEPEITEMLRQGRRLQRSEGEGDFGERTLLLLDDDENVLSSLKRLLRRDNYKILTATNAQAAFEILANQKVGVIVSDQRMPAMTGVEFLRRVKELYPASVRMVLSGYTDLDGVIDAINEGAVYRFMTKPWDDSLLRASIAEAFRRYATMREINLKQQQAAAKVEELSRTNGILQMLIQERATGNRMEASDDCVRALDANEQ